MLYLTQNQMEILNFKRDFLETANCDLSTFFKRCVNSDIDANNNDTPIDILDNKAGLGENAQDCEETESPPERSRERTTACRLRWAVTSYNYN